MLKDCLHIAQLPLLTQHSSGAEGMSHFSVTTMEQAPCLSLMEKIHADMKSIKKGALHDVIQTKVASPVAEGTLKMT